MAAGSGVLLVAGVLQALPAQAAYTAPGAMTGAGARPGATRLSFAAGDHVQAQVDVGTGNLLVSTSDLSLPGVSSDVDLGMAYNSLSIGTGAPQDSTTSAAGYGWTQLVGWGVVLVKQADGSVIYQGAGGLTGTFTPVSGSTSAYTSPAGIKADLVLSSTGWQLTSHDSGEKFNFDQSGVLTSVVDRNGNTTTVASSGGVPTSITSSRGSASTRTATVTATAGQITKITQSLGSGTARSVTYGYTGGDLTSVTDAAGRATRFTYSGHQLVEIVAPGGVDTKFTYDASHRVTSIDQVNTSTGSPGDSVTTLVYSTATKTLVYEPNQGSTGAADAYILTADGSQRVASVTDAAGRAQATTYNANFDALSQAVGSGSTGSTRTNTYGANSGESLTATAGAGGATDAFGYASTAASTKYLPTSSTDDAGNKSLYTYSGAGNQLTAADATGAQASVTYNADGTVSSATSPGNGTNATTYTYDTQHNLTGITPVTGSTLGARAFTQDAYGRTKTTTDGRGITTTYSYDSLDRITGVDYSATADYPDVAYTYDTAGRVATRADAAGTTSYGYDQMGRLTSRSNSADAQKLTYGYDKNSNLATSTNAAGTTTANTTTYTYDAGNALTAMVGQRKLYFVVDDHARRTDTYLGGNGPTATNWQVHSHTDYDTTGRVTRVTADKKLGSADPSTMTRVTDLAYCYAAGSTSPTCSTATTADRSFVQWRKDNLTGQVASYTYDAAARLAGASVTAGTASDGSAIAPVTYAYGYDARGNRTSATTTTGTGSTATTTAQNRTYNPGNQTTTAGFSYDGAGNLTADPAAGTIAYTAGDQMASVTRAGTTYTYTYAGTGNNELIGQTTPNGTYGYTFGRINDVGLPVIESASWAGKGSAYLYNDDHGTPVAITTSAGGQALYIYDAQGSPVALIGDGNNTAFTYSFDPYGVAKTTYASGGNAIDETPFLYTGGLNDRTTGWTKDGARYYNAGEGRWTQQDTLDAPLDPANANRYTYAADNPVNYIDSTGRETPCAMDPVGCRAARGRELFRGEHKCLIRGFLGGGTAGATIAILNAVGAKLNPYSAVVSFTVGCASSYAI